MKSDIPYLNFYRYVEKMHNAFKAWSEDASPLLNQNETLFDEFSLPCDAIMQSLYRNIPCPSLPSLAVKVILEKLSAGFLTVTERQLKDFLPGGRYHGIEDLALKKKMGHCKLTNLLGEACFGDLDFSLFKRRNASIHHHSTINMMKRNFTISAWFSNKTLEEQDRLLKLSAIKAKDLRRKHMDVQKKNVEHCRKALQAANLQKAEKEMKKNHLQT